MSVYILLIVGEIEENDDKVRSVYGGSVGEAKMSVLRSFQQNSVPTGG